MPIFSEGPCCSQMTSVSLYQKYRYEQYNLIRKSWYVRQISRFIVSFHAFHDVEKREIGYP